MIVRELLTRIGFQIDRKTEKQAGSAFEKLKGAAGKLGLALSAGAIALGFKKVIDAASDVEENLNVVNTAFQEQTQVVLDWARASGEAAGRSEYAMQEYAAAMGAVIMPTMGSAEATAELSTNLAQLAVDLGSFYNLSDEEALEKLRAGILGQSEPMQKFVGNMSVAALEAFRLEKGFKKSVKTMSESEKMMLRYQFIMAKTANVQGDAERTSGGFANQSKRLQGNIRTLAVNIGREVLPAAAGFLQTVNKLASAIKGPLVLAVRSIANVFRFVGTTIGGIIIGLGQMGTVSKIVFAAMLGAIIAIKAPFLITWLLIGAAVMGAILIVEDLWLALSEGKGVIAGLVGEFMYWLDEAGGIFTAFGMILKNAVDFWFEVLFGVPKVTEVIGQAIVDAFVWAGEAIRDGFNATAEFILSKMEWVAQAIMTPINWIADAISGLLDKLNAFTGGRLSSVLGAFKGIFGTLGDLDKAADLAPAGNVIVAGSPAAAAAAAEQRTLNANQTIEITVNATGGDPKAIGGAVAPMVGRAAGDQVRQVGQQLLAGGATP